MKVLSLFSGIGATEIAMAEFDDWQTVGFCEIEPYPVSILKKRFPGVPVYPDVTQLRGEDVGPVDLICGGFPCQDLSVAGKQRGLVDEDGNTTRSGLWFEMLRLVHECRPSWILAENVRGSINKALDAVQSGLREEGYEVRSVVLPASAVGAPHKRERVFVIGTRQDVADSVCQRSKTGVPGQNQGEEGDTTIIVNDGKAQSGMMWPTPNCSSATGAGLHGTGGKNLQTAVLWPTPSATPRGAHTGARSGGVSDDGKTRISANGTRWGATLETAAANVKHGQLSPDWVECLCGFPIGWTDIECDEPAPWPGWPAPMGAKPRPTPCANEVNKFGQYPYEPPRTVVGMKNRAKRLKALGNSNPPQQYVPALMFIEAMRRMIG